jgi:hypothetical protein
MTRETVRLLKRAIKSGARLGASPGDMRLGSASALSLLDRSIAFGHGRLAVVRLAMAVEAGAPVGETQWNYCAKVAAASGDAQLLRIYQAAANRFGSSRLVIPS